MADGAVLALILAPIIFIGLLSFIFQSGLTEVEGRSYLANCPYPIYEGVTEDLTITGVNVYFNITHNVDIDGNETENDQDKVGTEFECTLTGELKGVSASTRQYGLTLFSVIPYGQIGFASDSLSAFFDKAYNNLLVVWLLIDAPAQVTGYAFWTYINIVLFAMIGLGVFLAVKP